MPGASGGANDGSAIRRPKPPTSVLDRLDIDWRWISYALDRGALISIDPDAHSINGFKDIRYGTLAAQKAGLTPTQNLSSFNLQQFKNYLKETKAARGI